MTRAGGVGLEPADFYEAQHVAVESRGSFGVRNTNTEMRQALNAQANLPCGKNKYGEFGYLKEFFAKSIAAESGIVIKSIGFAYNEYPALNEIGRGFEGTTPRRSEHVQ